MKKSTFPKVPEQLNKTKIKLNLVEKRKKGKVKKKEKKEGGEIVTGSAWRSGRYHGRAEGVQLHPVRPQDTWPWLTH